MEKEIYTCSPFWNTMHNDRLKVPQTYTSIRFCICCYVLKMDLIPMHSLCSCDRRRYAAMSNLSGDSGMLVSGRLSCALAPWITVSFHRFKDWFTISVVDMVCSQSWQSIMPPPKSLHKSLCLAQRKQSGSFSLNKLSGIPVLNVSWSFHQCICVWCKIGVHNLYLKHCQCVVENSV